MQYALLCDHCRSRVVCTSVLAIGRWLASKPVYKPDCCAHPLPGP